MERSSRGRSWMSWRVRPLTLALSLSSLCTGCGGDESSPPGSAIEAGQAEPSGSERAPSLLPGVAPTLGEGAGDVSSGDFIDDTAAAAELPSAALTPERACAAEALEAETIERVILVPVEQEVVVPSVFYLMLDSSGSMVQDPFTLEGLVEQILDLFGLGQTPPEPTKWDFALSGLKTFISDPASAGLELGLGYFPGGGTCDGAGYDVPAVALGVLPENAAALEASLDARAPTGGTPLEGALRGATGFCLSYNAQHPDASCVAVLITDGAAEECDARSAEALAAIAASAAERGVLTYAAGMQGADFAVLDAIGQAGGADCDPVAPGFACDLTANRESFIDALNGIRDRTRTQTRLETRIERQVQALPCEWQIPAPPARQSFDPGRVNVELVLPEGEPQAVANVGRAADCGSESGWFYDDALAPSSIQACPSTCELLSEQPEVRVELLFGCATNLR
jgi:hypothetical protein